MSLFSEIRKVRDPIFDTALVDSGGTILIGWYLAERYNWSKPTTIAGLFVLGFVTHKALRIETKLNKNINN